MNGTYFILYILLFAVIGHSNAQFKVLHVFNDTSGADPQSPLLLSAGKLYGTTYKGNANCAPFGTVYSVNTDGSGFKNLFDFFNPVANGAYPSGSLTLSVTGDTLFGSTGSGGTSYGGIGPVSGYGCIFSIKTDGSGYYKILDFNETNGSGPLGSLLLYQDKLFGMTSQGGIKNKGCIFSVNTKGTGYTKLLDFDSINGSTPQAPLTRFGNVLYGMTGAGGATNNGCIFSIHTDGTAYKKLFDFSLANSNGGAPSGGATISGNVLYGMTYGNWGQAGCVFSINIDGSGYKDLYDFNITNGGFPVGSLTHSQGVLYGTTSQGGINNSGVIFSINTDGTGYKDIFDFNNPVTGIAGNSLIITGDTLYGTAWGGPMGYGLVFSYRISPTGINELPALNEFDVNIYPNPTSICIQYSIISEKDKEVTLNILDIYGRLLLAEKISVVSGINIASIDVTRLGSGNYVLQLVGSSGIRYANKKFIVQ